MADYYIEEAEAGLYVIMDEGRPVRTPMSKKFFTQYEDLAEFICADVNQFGPHPLDSLSYITLHASYIDFGSTHSKDELIESVISGWNTEWDFALCRLEEFNNLYTGRSSVPPNVQPSIVLDPVMYFGPAEEESEVLNWMYQQPIRVICSMQVCGATFQSILVCYRLLQSDPIVPIENLAHGCIHLSGHMHKHIKGSTDEESKRNAIEFLEKIQHYASYPDEDALF